MCTASKAVKSSRKSILGETCHIGKVCQNDTFMRSEGALHIPGTNPADEIVCLEDGARITLVRIPPGMQSEYMLNPVEFATFREGEGLKRDQLEFRDNMRVPFVCFGGCGVKVYIGEATRDVVRQIDRVSAFERVLSTVS